VELLVVIGIIVVLIGILLPVVNHARQAAWKANSAASISNLAAAVERYRQDFNAYPGPVGNGNTVTPEFNTADGRNTARGGMTMTENLVLGLLGGWEPGANPPISSAYDYRKVGSGPMSHSGIVSARRRYPAYFDFVPGRTVRSAWGPNGTWNRPGVSLDSDNSYNSVDRVDIPEFIDAFPDQMPILYVRASAAAPSYVGGKLGPNTQYNPAHLLPYLKSQAAFPGNTEFPGYSSPGVRDFASVEAYFRNPAIGSDSTPTTWEVRQKDGFWLIGAGPDRKYGTKDDQTNFGSL
jgi:hypothetical protein